ncbi:MAG: cbb3-type cytochrome c oxidase subunit 3 [Rubrivivax sp.]|nr:cbb3-type cytochrome c oxidase subunit 3 [Rubrivivax sp.]MDP3221623.1 cbb3-type cytochrome c oxidase subunit 3 [Rubrivivax sp.]
MDVNDLRIAVTVIGLLLFMVLVVHTYSRRRRGDHDEAANLPFSGDAGDTGGVAGPGRAAAANNSKGERA